MRRPPRTPYLPGEPKVLCPAGAPIEQWLKWRTVGLGGSEVAAILGISPYATAFDIFRNKVNEDGNLRHLVELDAEEAGAGTFVRPELLVGDNTVFEWGHRLEEAVALKVADELGLVARPSPGLLQDAEHPIAIVTPDRIATRRRSWKAQGLIECKTAGDGHGWEDGGAPLHYRAQAQWQMMITGLDVCWLGCLELTSARTFYLVEVPYDADWTEELVEAGERFWKEHVEAAEPPMFDLRHPRTEELLKELHPEVIRPSVELTELGIEAAAEYHAAKAAVDEAQARLDEIKNVLRAELGDAGAGYDGDRKVVSWPEVTQRRVNLDRLRTQYPEIAAEVTETSTFRRLTVTKAQATNNN